MRQRLAFSIVRELESDILLLDEMLVWSDLSFRETCLGVLEKYKRDKKTLIVSSHNLRLIKRFCEKALLLHKGNQIAIGPANEIVDIYIHNKKKQQKVL